MTRRADPYSRLLSADGRRTLALPLSHHSCVPSPAWPADSFPPISSPTDAVIYELHVRDFSSRDSAVHPSARGKYAAFTQEVRPSARGKYAAFTQEVRQHVASATLPSAR